MNIVNYQDFELINTRLYIIFDNTYIQIISSDTQNKMNLDFQKARKTMVENQLKPNKIKEKKILDIFNDIPKENFVPQNYKSICYSDKDLKILNHRGYLKNLHLAQLIHQAEIKETDNVLHIGGLTGYMSSIISKLCNHLVIIEEDDNILMDLNNNLNKYEIENTKVFKSNLVEGYSLRAPYDLVMIDCPMYNLNKKIIQQVNSNSGRIIYIEKISDNLSKGYKITMSNNSFNKEYLFDVFSNFSIDKAESDFKF